jgi:plasmid stability protein
MAVNLSIKNVPEDLARKLRARAARHRRSLQGELLNILEESVTGSDRLGVDEVVRLTRKLGVRTKSESAAMVRSDRDVR